VREAVYRATKRPMTMASTLHNPGPRHTDLRAMGTADRGVGAGWRVGEMDSPGEVGCLNCPHQGEISGLLR